MDTLAKASLDKKLLDDAISKAKNATETKSAIPILSTFYLEFNKDNTLTIKSTDLENYFSIKIRAEVSQPGKLCVNSKKFHDIIKNLPSPEVVMFVEGPLANNEARYGSCSLNIHSKRSRFKLPVIEPDDFPDFPEKFKKDESSEDFNESSTKIDGKEILEGIKRCEYAISKEESRAVLSSLFLNPVNENGEQVLHFVSTDTHRLALYKIKKSLLEPFLIPKKSLKIIKSILSPFSTLEISFSKDKNFAFLESKEEDMEWALGIRLLEGSFPDYLSIIPINMPIAVSVNKKEILSLLKRIMSVVDASVIPLKISLADNIMIFEVKDPEFGEAKDEIDVDYIGENFEIGLNARYLKEAIEVIEGPSKDDEDFIEMKFINEEEPIVIEPKNKEDNDYIAIIMPMRI